MAKNPFKSKNIVDTMINVGIGGAANVAVDYAINSLALDIEPDYMNLGKFILGTVGSSMVSNRYVKAAMDGVAVVGASNYFSKLLTETTTAPSSEATSGVPAGTVGRTRMIPPMKKYAGRFAKKTSGVPTGTVNNVAAVNC